MRTNAEREELDGEGAPRDGSARPIVVLLDDDILVLRTLCRVLAGADFEIVALSGTTRLNDYLENPRLSAVMLDIRLGAASGLQILDTIKHTRTDVEVIMMTGYASVESAVGAMRRGAFDYLSKPFDDLEQIRVTLLRALARRGIRSPEERRESPPGPRSALPVLRVADPADLPLSLDAYEKLALERALQENGGDAKRAAKALRIGRSTFYRKAARHGLALTRSDAGRQHRDGASNSAAPSGVGGPISIG